MMVRLVLWPPTKGFLHSVLVMPFTGVLVTSFRTPPRCVSRGRRFARLRKVSEPAAFQEASGTVMVLRLS